jgi:hypothetical protein
MGSDPAEAGGAVIPEGILEERRASVEGGQARAAQVLVAAAGHVGVVRIGHLPGAQRGAVGRGRRPTASPAPTASALTTTVLEAKLQTRVICLVMVRRSAGRRIDLFDGRPIRFDYRFLELRTIVGG